MGLAGQLNLGQVAGDREPGGGAECGAAGRAAEPGVVVRDPGRRRSPPHRRPDRSAILTCNGNATNRSGTSCSTPRPRPTHPNASTSGSTATTSTGPTHRRAVAVSRRASSTPTTSPNATPTASPCCSATPRHHKPAVGLTYRAGRPVLRAAQPVPVRAAAAVACRRPSPRPPRPGDGRRCSTCPFDLSRLADRRVERATSMHGRDTTYVGGYSLRYWEDGEVPAPDRRSSRWTPNGRSKSSSS